MWKKIILSAAAASIAAAAVIIPSYADSDEITLRKGDTVQYIFTMGECENAAGINVDSFYAPDFLELSEEPEFLVDGQGLSNTNEPGLIKWNTMFTGGRSFSDEDIVIETFIVRKKCTTEQAGLSFECKEIFSHDLQIQPTELLTARINVLETGTDVEDEDSEEPVESDSGSETDEPSDTENQSSEPESSEAPAESKAESRSDNTVTRTEETSSIKPVVITSTDLTPEEDDTIDNTSSSSVSSKRMPRYVVSTNIAQRAAQQSSAAAASAKSASGSQESSSNTASSSKNSAPGSQSNASKAAESSAAAQSAITSSQNVTSEVEETPTTPSHIQNSDTSPNTSSAANSKWRILIAAAAAIFVAGIATVILSKKIKAED